MTAITSDDHLHREAVIHAEMIRAAFRAARGLPLSDDGDALCTPSSTLTAPGVRALASTPGWLCSDLARPQVQASVGRFLAASDDTEGGDE